MLITTRRGISPSETLQEAVVGASKAAVPPRILRFLRGRPPLARSVVICASPISDVTMFALTLAESLGIGAQLGMNYVTTRPADKLALRYPLFRGSFSPDGVAGSWLQVPKVRSVSRDALNILLEVVQFGNHLPEVPDRDLYPDGIPGDQQEIGGSYRSDRPPPSPEEAPNEPILPEFERLWDYLDRCAQVPALLIIDSIDALAAKYGLEPTRLINAIQRDLVETGAASVVYVYQGEDRPRWFQEMDGVLFWTPIRNAGVRPHWQLTIEYLLGRVTNPERHVITMENGRLVCLPSDHEVVLLLEGTFQRARPRGMPAKLVGYLLEAIGEAAKLPD